MAEMKLTYFNGRGAAELARLLFVLGGKKFTDNRLSSEEWAKLKPSTPKGQLPVLEVDGKMMCESAAIARYVARETGAYGSNNWEAAICDMVLDTIKGVVEAAIDLKSKAKTEEEKAAASTKMTSEIESLEKLVASLRKGTFMLGDKASLADAALLRTMEVCETVNPDFKPDFCKTVACVAKNFSELSAIAEWLKNRPETPF